MLVLVGTYTGSGSESIYTLRMDPASGRLERVTAQGGITNPSFLAVHPSLDYVYAVQETGEDNAVFAYRLDRATGELTPLGSRPAHGAAPCHLTVDPSGSAVIVANYSAGTLAVFRVQNDGSLSEATQVIQHEGSGPDEGRQEGPHAHSVTMDPTGSRVVACDLGIDRVIVYDLSTESCTLQPAPAGPTAVAPGAGPRHFAFHPSGQYGYVVNELDSTVVALEYAAETGGLDPIQVVSTLPPEFEGTSHCADIRVHPSGRFLYASNRGHDSIACYRIDPGSGRLELVEIEASGGETPRNFNIEPSGRYLYAANQGTGNIVQLAIDPETGELTPTGHQTEVPAPVCLVFVPTED
jgi:6-phosphogluconolactonase